MDGSLGRGGMSEVFHGYDERLDRRVAIKILRPLSPGSVPAAPDSPEAAEILDGLERDRKRFLREIRTTAQLEHPGTPAVYDTGVATAPDGSTQLWLVMQLLRGSTLEAALDRADYAAAAPSVAWAAAIAAQIAAVLADVHRVDIVHRDIKPANVMLVDGGLVKVLDFGIAILRGGGALPRLTQVDRTVGTPAYMSPEQCLGQAVTSASDIYSLGCLLHELLTGDVPFHGTADVPLRNHHLHSPAPSVRAQRADVPAAVTALALSMLAKDPRARPSAAEVYEALLPLTSAPGGSSDDGESRDPTRPFRRPLLLPAQRREQAAGHGRLTDAGAERLMANVRALLDSERPSEAISLLEDGVARPVTTPSWSSGCGTSWAPRCSTPGNTPAPRRYSTSSGATTGGTCRRTTPMSSTAPTTQATPTPRSAGRTRPCRSCGSTCRTPTRRRTRTRRVRSSNPASSSLRCSPPPAIPTRD
ncbi:MAG TPA: serine/threonine-protein kinase [Streptosporangiaceae bacterium]|nr:serine/threonine-protein kinase [Streptosporangiaceae bacterium]